LGRGAACTGGREGGREGGGRGGGGRRSVLATAVAIVEITNGGGRREGGREGFNA